MQRGDRQLKRGRERGGGGTVFIPFAGPGCSVLQLLPSGTYPQPRDPVELSDILKEEYFLFLNHRKLNNV